MLFSVSTLAATSAIAPSLSRISTTLVLGDSGTEVVELQKLLLHWSVFSGYTSDVGEALLNGQFDGVVRAAVERFQTSMFLQADGVVGGSTWQALYTGTPIDMPTLKLGNAGIEVARLQHMLVATGDLFSDNATNGKFDQATEQAVQQLQERLGLTADGVVGMETWCALSKAIAGL